MPIQKITSGVITANTIANSAIQTGAVENYMNAAGLGFGMRNRIINGAMQVWQRGTSFTGINNSPTYSADRWGGFVAAVVTGEQILRSTSVPTGFQYSAAFGRTASNTNTNSIFLVQLIESVNMLDLASQTVTLSFWAKSGANYSGGNLSVLVNSGTSADQSLATFSGGPCTGYTGNASVINGSQTTTSTWTRYSFTGSVGATAQELGVAFGYTPTGTAGADDNIYITGVQLEKGSTATSFDYRPYGTEFQLCQRYFYKVDGTDGLSSVGAGMSISTTEGRIAVQYPVKMRASPTASYSGTIYILNTTGAGTTVTSIASNYGGAQGAMIGFGVASGMTVGAGNLLITASGASNYFQASAEL
jgi:hypothetical protein